MWIARDKDGSLWIYNEKPKKCDVGWLDEKLTYSSISSELFPDIKWEDDEPTEVEIVIDK